MLQRLLKKIVGDTDERMIARLQEVVEEINQYEPELERLDDDQLRAKTDLFRQRLRAGASMDDVLPEAFAVVREAAKRTVGLRHYDVQLIGGILLHQARIAEMKTGEGKTLVATLPLYLNALSGRGVHLVTVNDYLARRDGGWMGSIFHALGMSVGLVIPHASGIYDPTYIDPTGDLEDERLVHWRPAERKAAYWADITYGTNNEYGFDYLRDNMAHDLDDQVQRDRHYAIIDEVDNVLIDEARTPLIISGPAEEPSDLYGRFASLVPRLRASSPQSVEEEAPDGDYVVEERTQVVTLTDRGVEKVEHMLPEIGPGESLYDSQHTHMLPYLDNALRAHVVFKRDKQYIVKNGEVIIVDEFTGRLMYGRRFSEGLHQAIEAKEGVAVRRESMTYATITFQNFFRMYEKLAGMTGTAKTEEEEFRKIYDLDVVALPTNVEYRATYGDLVAVDRPVEAIEEVTFVGGIDGPDPLEGFGGTQNVQVTTYVPSDGSENGRGRRFFKRLDLPDVIYGTQRAKFTAIADEIGALHQVGQPVLVGTIAIETSEHLAGILKKRNVPHRVLNGKLHEKEAVVIAQAGSPGAVTIATNMAGRGVDIVLGGNPEGLAARLLETRFKQVAEGFAQAIIEDRPEQALQKVAGSPGFSSQSVVLAQELRDEYEVYEQAITSQQSGLARFIADRLLDEGVIGRRLHGPVVATARSVLEERWVDAMAGARLPERLAQNLIAEIQRVRAHYEEPGSKKAYIANGLFNHYYEAMSAVIRAVLQEDQKRTQELITSYPEINQELVDQIREVRKQWEVDRERVRALGGLHVLGTERHESRRIDNQLRGRSGRQGDPGSSRFYVSLEDELMRRFGGEQMQDLMSRFGVEDDVPLQHAWLDRTLESAQTRVEGYNFDLRKHVLEYDDVVSKQREMIYDQRRQVLSADDLRDQVLRMVQEQIERLVAAHMPGPDPTDWTLTELFKALSAVLPLSADMTPQQWSRSTPDLVLDDLCQLAEERYDELNAHWGRQLFDQLEKEGITLRSLAGSADPLRRLAYRRMVEKLGSDPDAELLQASLHKLRSLVPEKMDGIKAAFVDAFRLYRDRQLILRVVDGLWVRHLTDLSVLREGIGLRAYGQQDPLVAYRKEAHDMYTALLSNVQEAVVRGVYRTPLAVPARGQGRSRPVSRSTRRPARRPAGASQPSGPAPDKLPGRNDPCWCGSGLKYKNCHLRLDREKQRGSAASSRPSRASANRRKRRRKRRR